MLCCMLLFKVGNVLACQRLLYASVHAFASEGFGDVGEVVGSAFNGDGVFAAAGGLQQADVGADACAFGSIKQVAIGGKAFCTASSRRSASRRASASARAAMSLAVAMLSCSIWVMAWSLRP